MLGLGLGSGSGSALQDFGRDFGQVGGDSTVTLIQTVTLTLALTLTLPLDGSPNPHPNPSLKPNSNLGRVGSELLEGGRLKQRICS